MKSLATGLTYSNRRPADFPQDTGMAGPGRGGQVGGASMEAFIGQNGEGDGFFRVAVDTEVGGRPKQRGIERIPQPPHQLRVLDAAAGGDDLVDSHLRSNEVL